MKDSEETSENPETTGTDANAVRQQLDHMLSHPLFCSSKRCQSLLKYLVDHALSGNQQALKERTLGVEVFGRKPDYDTNEHPVVRSAASDIRKRIAQYYFLPEHVGELRIELPAGSYAPKIYLPELTPVAQTTGSIPEQTSVATSGFRYIPRRKALFGALAAVILILAGWGIYTQTQKCVLDRFWAPLFSYHGPLILNVTAVPPLQASEDVPSPIKSPLGIPFVSYTDTSALAYLSNLLNKKQKTYSISIQSFNGDKAANQITPTLAKLREGPSVFIGNSDWALHFMSTLRFHQGQDLSSDRFWIADKQHPEMKKWILQTDQPYDAYTRDYAIISRIHDPSTGHNTVTLTGLGFYGTAAAAEFVTNEADMRQVAPPDSPFWKKKTIQIVIFVNIVGTSRGAPKLLTSYGK